MKALLKIGLIAALCLAGGSVYSQTPAQSGGRGTTQTTPAQVVVPKKTPAPKKGKTVVKAQPAKKAEARPTKEY